MLSLKGRERQYFEQGQELIATFCNAFSDIATIDIGGAKENDKTLSATLCPKSKGQNTTAAFKISYFC